MGMKLLAGYKVRVKIETKDDYYWEDLSGVIQTTLQDARDEIVDTLYNPQYAGYEFDILEVWI